MKLVRACVVVGAASLLIGVPAASAAPSVSIHVKKREILFGKSTKITGHVGGVAPNSGQQVKLYSNPYPYKGFHYESSRKTNSHGNYSFTTGPDRNTLFMVQLIQSKKATASSAKRFIYVDGVTKWKLKFKKGSRTIRVSFVYSFSPQLNTSLFVGVPLRWYFKTSSQKKYHRVATNKTKRVAAGSIGGNLKYTYPNSVGKQKYTVSWCFQPKKKGDIGVGVPGKAFKKCT